MKKQKVYFIKNDNKEEIQNKIDEYYGEEPWNTIVVSIKKLKELFFNNQEIDYVLFNSLFKVIFNEALWKGYNIIISLESFNIDIELMIHDIIKEFNNIKREIQIIE